MLHCNNWIINLKLMFIHLIELFLKLIELFLKMSRLLIPHHLTIVLIHFTIKCRYCETAYWNLFSHWLMPLSFYYIQCICQMCPICKIWPSIIEHWLSIDWALIEHWLLQILQMVNRCTVCNDIVSHVGDSD